MSVIYVGSRVLIEYKNQICVEVYRTKRSPAAIAPPANPPVGNRAKCPSGIRAHRERSTYASVRECSRASVSQVPNGNLEALRRRPGIARGSITEVSGVDCLVPAAIRIPSSHSVLAPPSPPTPPLASSAICLSLFFFIFASSVLPPNVSREFSSFFFSLSLRLFLLSILPRTLAGLSSSLSVPLYSAAAHSILFLCFYF